ncbi:glycosyltransferase [candidate division KSB1 bacterium]|nr:glycosyltransferase [candidate division KSB1 bacterium]
MKNVLMILQSDFPPDMRVQKEALSLINAGYKVSIISDNRIKKPRRSNENGIDVFRMRHYSALGGKLHKIINAPMYPNPVWSRAIRKAVIEINAEILHVHDLPLALSTMKIADSFNLPVIFDLHENYPAAMEQWYKPGPVGWTIRNPNFARYLERICLNRADKIIVIAEEHRDLLASRGIPEDKIYIVENTPYKKTAFFNNRDRSLESRYEQHYNLVYFGILNPERKIDVALKAMPLIKSKIPNVKLVVIGRGPSFNDFKNLAHELHLDSDVEFLGWLSLQEAEPYFHLSDILIMPHSSNEFLDNGVPNKLFEYMAFGKPVVVPESKASARVVREADCGEIFVPEDSNSFADAIFKIAHADKNYGMNGKNIILNKYNWETTEKELLKLYHNLSNS